MNKVKIRIDWVPNNYSAAPFNEDIACIATGATLDDIQNNIVDALKFHVDGLREDGDPVPQELEGDWEPEFVLTTRAQLKYADNYITRKALARETGIAEQQLSHYANGQRHAKPSTQSRIVSGIQAICSRLAVIV